MTFYFSSSLQTRLAGLAAAALAILLLGCGDGTGTAQPESSPGLTPVSFQEWEQQLKSYRPAVVVVDLWAMWCTPCIERFPEMVKMHEAYSPRGVEIVGVNVDNRQDQAALQEAAQFVKDVNATFDNFHMDENLMEAFAHFQLDSIPAVLIYDDEGNERYRLTNEPFTHEDIEEAVDQLLSEQQGS